MRLVLPVRSGIKTANDGVVFTENKRESYAKIQGQNIIDPLIRDMIIL